jgi:hypothetical protein
MLYTPNTHNRKYNIVRSLVKCLPSIKRKIEIMGTKNILPVITKSFDKISGKGIEILTNQTEIPVKL